MRSDRKFFIFLPKSFNPCVSKYAFERLYLLTILKHSGVDKKNLILFYKSKIRTLLCYASPAWCNATGYLISSLERSERRAYSVISSDPDLPLSDFMNNMACNLLSDITSPDHSLYGIFLMNSRKNMLTAPIAKTTRYYKSFIKYAR